jgi:hypothetical protein
VKGLIILEGLGFFNAITSHHSGINSVDNGMITKVLIGIATGMLI